jgi:hypothetical protein
MAEITVGEKAWGGQMAHVFSDAGLPMWKMGDSLMDAAV